MEEEKNGEEIKRITITNNTADANANGGSAQKMFFKNGKKTIIPKKVSNSQIDALS